MSVQESLHFEASLSLINRDWANCVLVGTPNYIASNPVGNRMRVCPGAVGAVAVRRGTRLVQKTVKHSFRQASNYTEKNKTQNSTLLTVFGAHTKTILCKPPSPRCLRMPNGCHKHDDEPPPRTRLLPAKYYDPVQTQTPVTAQPRRSLKRDPTTALPSLKKLKHLVSAKGVAAVAHSS